METFFCVRVCRKKQAKEMTGWMAIAASFLFCFVLSSLIVVNF